MVPAIPQDSICCWGKVCVCVTKLLLNNATHNHEVNDVYHMQKNITLSDMRAEVQKLLPVTCKIVYDSSTTHQNDRSALKSADTVSLGSHALGAPFPQKHTREHAIQQKKNNEDRTKKRWLTKSCASQPR